MIKHTFCQNFCPLWGQMHPTRWLFLSDFTKNIFFRTDGFPIKVIFKSRPHVRSKEMRVSQKYYDTMRRRCWNPMILQRCVRIQFEAGIWPSYISHSVSVKCLTNLIWSCRGVNALKSRYMDNFAKYRYR